MRGGAARWPAGAGGVSEAAGGAVSRCDGRAPEGMGWLRARLTLGRSMGAAEAGSEGRGVVRRGRAAYIAATSERAIRCEHASSSSRSRRLADAVHGRRRAHTARATP